jgi:hypothetical protein
MLRNLGSGAINEPVRSIKQYAISLSNATDARSRKKSFAPTV